MTVRALVLLGALALACNAEGHALDEYVQSLKIGVLHDRIELHLSLTPGVNIAADVLRRIDVNGDDLVSVEEAEAYGRAVTADLAATLDGTPLTLSLTHIEVPMPADLRAGNSAIGVDVVIHDASTRGRHRLTLRNSHLPAMSVYLANALLPDSRDIQIIQQTRDPRQQTYVLDYGIRDVGRASTAWLFIATAGLALLVGMRTRANGSTSRGIAPSSSPVSRML